MNISGFISKGEIGELGKKRLEAMDAAGVDVQILSYGNNNPMELPAQEAIPRCRLANDLLYEACKASDGRLYGFAALPVDDVDASVKELERCVKELGFKGLCLNGTFQGHFFDEERFFPILEKAAELNIPVMFHPGEVDEKVSSHYY